MKPIVMCNDILQKRLSGGRCVCVCVWGGRWVSEPTLELALLGKALTSPLNQDGSDILIVDRLPISLWRFFLFHHSLCLFTKPAKLCPPTTGRMKEPLSVRGRTQTGDNGASAGAREFGMEERCVRCVRGVEGYGTTPHKGSPEIAPLHNETCHSVYEIMSNWKHCSHCAPVTGSIVQIALSPHHHHHHLSFSIDAVRLFLAIVATRFSLFPLSPPPLSIIPSPRIVIISLLICFFVLLLLSLPCRPFVCYN